ncbi:MULTISPECIES: acyl carrier protein [Actinomycetes]|uniref:Acyl carrier protein n=4 Tax=Actinomycetes TaxID=1760 RepID=A0A7H1PWH6_9ACTN|nr:MULTISPECIES: acyl carrier protein [Streptomyces]QNT92406.1 acyl carrier protein [Streptomyces griseofuscus]WDO05622.1 acyl carrier protein [Streptomyces murinus]SCF97025.1 Phosphopantetheine attachment site [Streptomyces sp. DconLS]
MRRMSPVDSTIQRLRDLPRSELTEEIETIVLKKFKVVLLMDDSEDLPVDVSYFDLGLTSLRLTEIRQSLEQLLDLSINVNVLFNEPTITHLVDHLTQAVQEV